MQVSWLKLRFRSKKGLSGTMQYMFKKVWELNHEQQELKQGSEDT